MKVLTFDGLTRFLNNLKDLFTLKSEFTQHTSNHAPKTITGGDNILLAYDGVMDKLTIEAVRRPTLFYSSVTASDSTSSLDYDDIDTTNTPSGVIPKEGDFILCSNGYLFKINYAGSSLGVSLCHVVEDGEDGETYKMQVSALAIGKTASGSYKQSTITMKGYRQVGSGLFALYACRFKIETTTSTNLSSASWTSRYTATSNASSYAYTIPSGVTGIRCSMYLAGGTSTLLDQVIIPIIMDGMDASLSAVEDLSSGITASGTYVDTTKQVEKIAYRYGKVVQAHLTFYAKTALSSAVTLFSGLPKMNNTMQFVGMNYTTKTPVVFAVRETGEFQMWYAGTISAGDLIRVGLTYICQ